MSASISDDNPHVMRQEAALTVSLCSSILQLMSVFNGGFLPSLARIDLLQCMERQKNPLSIH